jgi:hypothetical protein
MLLDLGMYVISKGFLARRMQETGRNQLDVGLCGMRVMFVQIWVTLRGLVAAIQFTQSPA